MTQAGLACGEAESHAHGRSEVQHSRVDPEVRQVAAGGIRGVVAPLIRGAVFRSESLPQAMASEHNEALVIFPCHRVSQVRATMAAQVEKATSNKKRMGWGGE